MATCKTDTRLEECAAYFKSKEGFSRLFEKMKDKYKTFGSVNGTVVLENLSTKEKEALEDLLKKDFSRNDTVSITLHKLKKIINESKYQGLALEEILFAYFNEALFSNRQIRENYSNQRSNFFHGLMKKYQGTSAGEWLENIWQDKENAYRILLQRYTVDKEELRNDIDIVSKALENLPYISDERLQFGTFAAKVTKDPHAFDMDTSCGELFLYSLMHKFQVYKPSTVEERAELFYRAGIIVEDVSNYVLSYGLLGYTDDGVHAGWQAFYQSKEPMLVTLSNLGKIKRIVSPCKKVFVVENVAVYGTIIDRMDSENIPLVCTYRQIKLAGLAILDILIAEGTEVYYSGDYDPEGLSMADRLVERYGDKIKLWRYSIEDYHIALSDEVLNGVRLRKLKKLKDNDLVALGEEIRINGFAGYQELIVERLIQDIKEKYVSCNQRGF